jgi:hypothetical protein
VGIVLLLRGTRTAETATSVTLPVTASLRPHATVSLPRATELAVGRDGRRA